MLEEPSGSAPAKPGAVVDLPHPGRYGLVGREGKLGELEGAFQRSPIVLLTGPAGIGKTELACGFARRVAEMGERPGSVLFTSFSYGAGLCRVIHEIGTTFGGRFRPPTLGGAASVGGRLSGGEPLPARVGRLRRRLRAPRSPRDPGAGPPPPGCEGRAQPHPCHVPRTDRMKDVGSGTNMWSWAV